MYACASACVDVCLSVCKYEYACRCLSRAEEGIGPPGAGVPGICERIHAGAGNQVSEPLLQERCGVFRHATSPLQVLLTTEQSIKLLH